MSMTTVQDGGVTKPSPMADRMEERKERRSKWDYHGPKTFVPGIPTYLPRGLTHDELDALLLRIRIEEIGYKVSNNQLDIEYLPESTIDQLKYDKDGRRINVSAAAAKQRLLDERHWLIMEAYRFNPNFKPPNEYRSGATKLSRKIYIPVNEFPDYNFVGLIIGPRGTTQKQLEKETGARIAIRGREADKDGRYGDDDDDIHVLIQADTMDQVRAASKIIRKLLVPIEESDNDHKRQQLRKLAEYNGTLKDPGFQPIHRTWQSADVYCKHCGEISHTTGDCPLKNRPVNQVEVDKEYLSFMSEIGAAPEPTKVAAASERDYADFMNSLMSDTTSAAIVAQGQHQQAQQSATPWNRAPAPPTVQQSPMTWAPTASVPQGYPTHPTGAYPAPAYPHGMPPQGSTPSSSQPWGSNPWARQ